MNKKEVAIIILDGRNQIICVVVKGYDDMCVMGRQGI